MELDNILFCGVEMGNLIGQQITDHEYSPYRTPEHFIQKS
jgi:hypothetical protein